jgi:hypothetical protein
MWNARTAVWGAAARWGGVLGRYHRRKQVFAALQLWQSGRRRQSTNEMNCGTLSLPVPANGARPTRKRKCDAASSLRCCRCPHPLSTAVNEGTDPKVVRSSLYSSIPYSTHPCRQITVGQ